MPDEIFIFDAGGCGFNLQSLALILSTLNHDGEIIVKGVLPGSVDMLALGAALAEMAQSGNISSAVAAVLACEGKEVECEPPPSAS